MRKHSSLHRHIWSAVPFFHDIFSGRVNFPLGSTDLVSSAILYAISHSFIAKQGYAKSQDVNVKGLNENSFSPLLHLPQLRTRCDNGGK